MTERQVIEQGRQPALKLGLALQIGFLRMSGRILEDPTFIQHELDRRLAAARAADPTKKREQGPKKGIIRVGKSVERILSAYQEGLVSLDQLRERMPPLRQRERALREEARAIADQSNDSTSFLRSAETLTAFLTRLRNSANTLDVMERQRIVRLVVKDVLIGDDTLVIRHCIPIVAPSASTLPGVRERTWKGTCVSGGVGGRRCVGINFRQRIVCRNPVETGG